MIDAVMKQLDEMSGLLLTLSANVIAHNQRFDRIEARLDEIIRTLDRMARSGRDAPAPCAGSGQ